MFYKINETLTKPLPRSWNRRLNAVIPLGTSTNSKAPCQHTAGIAPLSNDLFALGFLQVARGVLTHDDSGHVRRLSRSGRHERLAPAPGTESGCFMMPTTTFITKTENRFPQRK